MTMFSPLDVNANDTTAAIAIETCALLKSNLRSRCPPRPRRLPRRRPHREPLTCQLLPPADPQGLGPIIVDEDGRRQISDHHRHIYAPPAKDGGGGLQPANQLR
ncbi:hypothetical protein PVAP13_4NG197711 [Panicum virgatum]|uniref:Uncharacterized protein n=1 Tax=Panicum virgatum TaxID=38727 RepID=A0A8T0T702_PANVG|nr:hypothetical protein PVAP13_4NG197711 [Panicum virgatum]